MIHVREVATDETRCQFQVSSRDDDIPIMTSYRCYMPPRIGPKKPQRLFLRLWREAKGVTQQQIADRVGTTKGTVSKWENGAIRPSLGVVAAYAEALDESPARMYGPPPAAEVSPPQPDLRQIVVEVITELEKRRQGGPRRH